MLSHTKLTIESSPSLEELLREGAATGEFTGEEAEELVNFGMATAALAGLLDADRGLEAGQVSLRIVLAHLAALERQGRRASVKLSHQ